jgi:hypothetical protein
MAAMIRGGYAQAWPVIFEQKYQAACGGRGEHRRPVSIPAVLDRRTGGRPLRDPSRATAHVA